MLIGDCSWLGPAYTPGTRKAVHDGPEAHLTCAPKGPRASFACKFVTPFPRLLYLRGCWSLGLGDAWSKPGSCFEPVLASQPWRTLWCARSTTPDFCFQRELATSAHATRCTNHTCKLHDLLVALARKFLTPFLRLLYTCGCWSLSRSRFDFNVDAVSPKKACREQESICWKEGGK